MSAQDISVEYLQDFTKRISKCSSLEEYYDLVGSVFIFAELVHIHFKELYEESGGNADPLLLELKEAAKVVAAELQSKKTNLSEKLN